MGLTGLSVTCGGAEWQHAVDVLHDIDRLCSAKVCPGHGLGGEPQLMAPRVMEINDKNEERRTPEIVCVTCPLQQERIMTQIQLNWLLVLAGTIFVCQGPLWAQERDFGQSEYQRSCAACHGIDAKGNGPVAAQLKTAPADLTRLAERNGGVFPFSSVYETIDGRKEVKAHSTRDMPVWGYSFMPSSNLSSKPVGSWSLDDVADPEPVVRGRILALIDYLNRMQKK